ncbi:MAG: RNA polymerase factor sigma-54 [Lachnospiraceae bacterium]|nr:RNA polymerase factor sigma-54 [Lachnospiraceae bacterium]
MENRLEQANSQILSQKMIQAVNILQMGTQELSAFIQEFSMENPVVDVEIQEEEAREDERLKKIEWLAELDEQNREYYSTERRESEGWEFDHVSQNENNSLKETLMMQLIGCGHSVLEMELFSYIADCLDSRGYFVFPVEDLMEHMSVSRERAEKSLAIMKNLEPAGVCAGSLQECLLIQLERKEYESRVEQEIVEKHLEQLGKMQLSAIARQMKIPLEKVRLAAERIKSLNPKPAQGFGSDRISRYVSPDVTVVKFENYFQILTNDYAYSSFHINIGYLRMMQTEEDQEVRAYLSRQIKRAQEMQEYIGKRKATLISLTKCIVDIQKDFFIHGGSNIRPFSMTEAAQMLRMNVSTVSRAVNDKYLQCCWGLYPLAFFFRKGPVSDRKQRSARSR